MRPARLSQKGMVPWGLVVLGGAVAFAMSGGSSHHGLAFYGEVITSRGDRAAEVRSCAGVSTVTSARGCRSICNLTWRKALRQF